MARRCAVLRDARHTVLWSSELDIAQSQRFIVCLGEISEKLGSKAGVCWAVLLQFPLYLKRIRKYYWEPENGLKKSKKILSLLHSYFGWLNVCKQTVHIVYQTQSNSCVVLSPNVQLKTHRVPNVFHTWHSIAQEVSSIFRTFLFWGCVENNSHLGTVKTLSHFPFWRSPRFAVVPRHKPSRRSSLQSMSCSCTGAVPGGWRRHGAAVQRRASRPSVRPGIPANASATARRLSIPG